MHNISTFVNNSSHQYTFFSYIKHTFNLFFLKKNTRIAYNGRYSTIVNLLILYKAAIFSNYIIRDKNIFSFNQFMFIIKSNPKQYFLTFSGINLRFFRTASTGKILKRKKLVVKSLKKSHKALKYLLLYVKDIINRPASNISYYLLNPINRKNLNFLYLVFRNCEVSIDNLGFRHYYKSIFRTERRIKRRIKKRLLSQFTYYN